jgi:hypothetical protein
VVMPMPRSEVAPVRTAVRWMVLLMMLLGT